MMTRNRIFRNANGGINYIKTVNNTTGNRAIANNGGSIEKAHSLFMLRFIAFTGVVRLYFYAIQDDLNTILDDKGKRKFRTAMDYMTLFEHDYLNYVNNPSDYILDIELYVSQAVKPYVEAINNTILAVCDKRKYNHRVVVAKVETVRLLIDSLLAFHSLTVKVFKNSGYKFRWLGNLTGNLEKCYSCFVESVGGIYPKIQVGEEVEGEITQRITQYYDAVADTNLLYPLANRAYDENKELCLEWREKHTRR